MDIENAIARSISHNEIAHCTFEGDEAELRYRIKENTADYTDYQINVSEENDGSLDVYSLDDGHGAWRIRVTLA
jgi:hypothetical protein